MRAWDERKNDGIGGPIQVRLQTWLIKKNLDVFISTEKKIKKWSKECKSFLSSGQRIQLEEYTGSSFFAPYFSHGTMFYGVTKVSESKEQV